MGSIRGTMAWVAVLALACAPGEGPGEAGPVPPAAEPIPEPADTTEREPEAPLTGPTAAEYAAMDALIEAQLAYERGEVATALELAEGVIREHQGTGAVVPAYWVGARAAFASGEYTRAGELAGSYAETQPSGSQLASDARVLVELAGDALQRPTSEPARIGVLLPRSGDRALVRFADWVLDGMRVAEDEFEERFGRDIELVIADDEGGPRTAEAIAELERQGVVAVLGPLLPQQLPTAARARIDRDLVLLSPTLPETPTGWSAVYTVNTGDTRGAQQLGRYAANVGLPQAALLFPRSPGFERKAQAFAVEYEALGGDVKASVPYDSGTTTFARHMERILAAVAPEDTTVADSVIADSILVDPFFADSLLGDSALALLYADSTLADSLVAALRDTMPYDTSDPWLGKPPQQPFALFVAAPARDVPQIAPQVAFYGLDSAGVQIFGDEGWTTVDVRRRVPSQDLQGVIAASHFPPDRADAPVDPDFLRRYEERYRRSLEGGPLPALGYDAANLVIQALPHQRLTPQALHFRLRLLSGIRGATGVLSVRANRVVRTPFLVRITGGDLKPAPYPWEYSMPVPKPPLPPEDTLVEDVGDVGRRR